MASVDDVAGEPTLVPGGWLGIAFLIALVAFAFVVIVGEVVAPTDTTKLPPPDSSPPTSVTVELVNGRATPLNCSQVDLRLNQCP